MFLSMLKIAAVGILESITDVFLHTSGTVSDMCSKKSYHLNFPQYGMHQLINFSDYIEKYYCRRTLTQ